jgi:hypothetical protein
MTIATHYELSAGDYVELVAEQERGGGPVDLLYQTFGMVKLP